MYMTRIALIATAALVVVGCKPQQASNNAADQGQANSAQQAQYIPRPPGPDQKIILVWKQATNEWKVKLGNNGPELPPDQAKTQLNKDDGPSKFEVHISGHPTATFKDPGGLDAWEGQNMKNQPQTGINSNQILGPVITKNKTLVFWFLNQPSPVTVNYRLNFNNGVVSVDPIIEN